MKCPRDHYGMGEWDWRNPPDLEPVYNRAGDQIGWFCRSCRRFFPGAGKPKTFGEKCRDTRARNRLPSQRRIVSRLHSVGPQSVRELCDWARTRERIHPYIWLPVAESTMREWLHRMEALGMVFRSDGRWVWCYQDPAGAT